MADEATLQKRLAELRSKTLRKQNNAEKDIRALYKTLLKDLQGFLGQEYAQLSKEGKLSYSILQQKGEYARFLEEVTKRVDGLSPDIVNEIQSVVRDTYELSYKGMVDAVSNAKGAEELAKELQGVKATIPEVVQKAVNNPIDKLTLSDTLEFNRVGITYNIRKQISLGLVNGDRYEEMAKRISSSLDNDYKKSIRIVRTEAHRVREQGLNDAAVDCSNAIKNGNSGLIMVKIWRTGQDQRVRDTHASMEGVTVLADEEFELPSDATAMSPGSSGVAGEDINCRCFCSYKLMTAEEYEKATGKKYEKAGTKSEEFVTYNKDDLIREYKNMDITDDEHLDLWGAQDSKFLDMDESSVDWDKFPVGYIYSDGSHDINSKLRKGQKLDYSEKRTADSLSRVIQKNTLSDNIEVTRVVSEDYVKAVFGMDIWDLEDLVADEMADGFIGTEITEKAFVSTSAKGLDKFRQKLNSGDVRLNLKAPKGTHAFVTDNYVEAEIIFDKGTKYKITGFDFDDDEHLIIEAIIE